MSTVAELWNKGKLGVAIGSAVIGVCGPIAFYTGRLYYTVDSHESSLKSLEGVPVTIAKIEERVNATNDKLDFLIRIQTPKAQAVGNKLVSAP